MMNEAQGAPQAFVNRRITRVYHDAAHWAKEAEARRSMEEAFALFPEHRGSLILTQALAAGAMFMMQRPDLAWSNGFDMNHWLRVLAPGETNPQRFLTQRPLMVDPAQRFPFVNAERNAPVCQQCNGPSERVAGAWTCMECGLRGTPDTGVSA